MENINLPVIMEVLLMILLLVLALIIKVFTFWDILAMDFLTRILVILLNQELLLVIHLTRLQ